MREIKVRGLSVEELVGNDQWITGFGVDFADMVDGTTEAYLYTTHSVYKVHPESVGQYTGLKDKNGKEIYEGDILSTDLSRPYLIVVYRNGAFMYQCHDSGEDYYDFMEPSDAEVVTQTKYHEVIGNIYEHPHLLEGRDEA